jgi:indolepyruvate ferredoxin oxidoreductase beta subunit
VNDVATAGTEGPITIAVTAMGGQGGGVLADWIVATAESQGWIAQSTSVPGVAQRTGATIYYVELIRPQQRNSRPVLSLMPVPGDVDIVIAAELMEAGRAIQRGLVTPDRTTLIASSHRSYAVTEKARPGDGRADAARVLATAGSSAQRFLHADMQALAEETGSVISAALFGALAGSGALPFDRAAYEATIRAAGVGVDASLRAFAAGAQSVSEPPTPAPTAVPHTDAVTGGSAAERSELARALDRIARDFPAEAREMLAAGLRRLVDYQDVAYAHDYLDRVAPFAAVSPELAVEAARQVAVALAYDDVVRVADLKTRAARAARVRGEVLAAPDHIIETTEFLHPRVEEICATLPAGLGRAVEASPALTAVLRALFERGRRVRSSGIAGFLTLYLVAGLRARRRTLLRHGREMAHVDAWLALAAAQLGRDDRLALEILKCRRLVKGYSDTHARGQSKFDKVTGAVPLLAGRADAADWIRRLRDAALADVDGTLLDGALRTVAQL